MRFLKFEFLTVARKSRSKVKDFVRCTIKASPTFQKTKSHLMVPEMYLGTRQTSFHFYVQQFIEVQKYSGI